MAQQTRSINKSRFETGDAPSQSDYTDLIDSFLSLADTSAQTVTSPVIISGTLGVGSKVSATTVSANAVNASAMTVLANVSASSGNFDKLIVGGTEVLPSGAGAGIEVYITATASTAITSAFTYFAMDVSAQGGAGTAASAVNAVQFTGSSVGTVKYTGTDSKRFVAHVVLSGKRAASNNVVAGVRVAKNGTTLPATTQTRSMTDGNIFSFSTVAIVSANGGDDIGVFLSNTVPAGASALSGIEVDQLNFVIVEA